MDLQDIDFDDHYDPLETRCRICGLDYGIPIREDDTFPTHDICFACGAETGVDDSTLLEIVEYRKQWIDGGMKWWALDTMLPRNPPDDWDPNESLKLVPKKYF